MLQKHCRGGGVELHIAGDDNAWRAQGMQALGIGCRLGIGHAQAAIDLPRQVGQALPLAQGFFTEPGIDQRHGDVQRMAPGEQLRPYFRFQNQAGARAKGV